MRWRRRTPSASPAAPGDRLAPARALLDRIARFRNDYAGLPVPINGECLVVEDRHPAAGLYAELGGLAEKTSAPAGCTVVNHWYSMPKRGEVYLWRERDGRLEWGVVPEPHHIDHDLRTMGCSVAWSVDSELKAQELLKTLVQAHTFKMYQLTGMFLETSRRSGVMYVFRRRRPTVAVVPDRRWSWKAGRCAHASREEAPGIRILTTLCLHPIGYYHGTWAGSMCPTDDVIAHLLLMRGDEKMFWRRANQIPPWRPEAGL